MGRRPPDSGRAAELIERRFSVFYTLRGMSYLSLVALRATHGGSQTGDPAEDPYPAWRIPDGLTV